jgi:parallel beta-helix repeat protein
MNFPLISTFQNIDGTPIGGGGGISAAVSVKDHGAIGDGIADDTAAINAAIAAASATNASRHIFFPAGRYKVATTTPAADYDWLFLIPSNFTVSGEGLGSVILWTSDCRGGSQIHPSEPSHMCFKCNDGTKNVVFQDLCFVGQNGTGGVGFTYEQNPQSAAIYCFGLGTTDITVKNCVFDNFWGFTVHMDMGPRGRVLDCTTRYCCNGINCNTAFGEMRGNLLFHSEGFECAASAMIVSDNTIQDALGSAVAIGGTYGPPGSNLFIETPGSQVVNNTITGCTNIGIVATDGFVNGIISGNTIRECEGGGILVSPDPGDNVVRGCIISDNTITNCCKSGNPNVWGIFLGGSGKHSCIGNRIFNEDAINWSLQIPIIVQSVDCYVSGNYLNGTNMDLYVGYVGTNTYVGENFFANQKAQFEAGSTRSPIRRYGATDSEVIETSSLSYGPGQPGLFKFYRLADGTLQWDAARGGGPDITLGRTGPHRLRTPDSFEAAIGVTTPLLLGGTTASALSTPAAPTFATSPTGGIITPGTYYYRVAAANAQGTSLASAEASVVVPGGSSTNTINVMFGLVYGATEYKVYGRSTGAEQLLATVSAQAPLIWGPVDLGLGWTDNGSVTPSGALPTINTTGNLTVDNTLITNLIAAPTLLQISASGSEIARVGPGVGICGMLNSYYSFYVPANTLNGYAAGSTLRLTTELGDGASSVAAQMNTTTAWTTTGAKLWSWKNNSVEKAALMHDGQFYGYTFNASNPMLDTSGTYVASLYRNGLYFKTAAAYGNSRADIISSGSGVPLDLMSDACLGATDAGVRIGTHITYASTAAGAKLAAFGCGLFGYGWDEKAHITRNGGSYWSDILEVGGGSGATYMDSTVVLTMNTTSKTWLFNAYNSGSHVMSLSRTGRFSINSPIPLSGATVAMRTAPSANETTLRVEGLNGQSQNLQSWVKNSDTTPVEVAYIAPDGSLGVTQYIYWPTSSGNTWQMEAGPNYLSNGVWRVGVNTVTYLGARASDGYAFSQYGFELAPGGTPVLKTDSSGRLDQSGTDESASPGASTINKPTGKSAIWSGDSSVTITNSLVSTSSRVLVTFHADHGAARWWVDVGSGSFTVTLSAAATADAAFSWQVSNII